MSNTLPYTIQSILDQIRAHRIMSAFIQCGVNLKTFTYRCPQMHGECRPASNSIFSKEAGATFDVGVSFKPNGKRGEQWLFSVAYELDDTYTVYLTGFKKGAFFLIESASEVYCDNLNEVLNRMYDDAIAGRNGGFIQID